MINILFAAVHESWKDYERPLRSAFAAAGIDANLSTDYPASEVDYIIYAPNSEVQDFSVFPKLKAVMNLWAGVENVIGNETLKVPLCRMVDPGLSEGMVEWVTGHVLRHHLGMDRHILGQDGVWRAGAAALARHKAVGILGLGTLGQACARALRALHFNVHGWSRTEKHIADVTCHFGSDGLRACLSGSDHLVVLLPLTDQTRDILNAERLAWLPKGASIINAGRGSLIDDEALLAALDSAHLSQATLDVFRTEPLPPEHPFWANPRVTVTPHIAAETRPDTASEVIAENIRRGENGEPLLHVVDRSAGY